MSLFLLSLVTPHTQCRLKLLKQERIKDYLLMEEEFIRNQEQMKPLEEKQEVYLKNHVHFHLKWKLNSCLDYSLYTPQAIILMPSSVINKVR